jgi:hypothetical protein
MHHFINVLENINRYYSRYFFVVLPAWTLVINGYDLLFKSSSLIQKLGNVSVGIIVIILTGLYIRTDGNNLFYMCGTIALTTISLFMFVTRRVEISNIAGITFVCIYAVMLVGTLAVKLLEK